MKNWRVKRGDSVLGHVVADELVLEGDGLYAKTNGRIAGWVASGPDLEWTFIPLNSEGAANPVRHEANEDPE